MATAHYCSPSLTACHTGTDGRAMAPPPEGARILGDPIGVGELILARNVIDRIGGDSKDTGELGRRQRVHFASRSVGKM